MRKIIIIAIVLLAGCARSDQNSKYLRWVGDAEFDPEMDAGDFQLCGSEKLVQQYFYFGQGLQYEGEKTALRKRFKEAYLPVKTAQSGWIRIRFIVNCRGQTGRFRMMGADLDYQEQIFDKKMTDQLLEITQSLDGWAVLSKNGKPRDYYQYLIFKINNGNLIDILP